MLKTISTSRGRYNNATEEAKNNSQKNWEGILKKLKEVVEGELVQADKK